MTNIYHLCADQFGAHIGKRSGRIRITVGGTLIEQAALIHLRNIAVIGTGISISTDAIRACSEHNIPIVMMDAGGNIYASLQGNGLNGTAQTRRAQFSAYHDQRGTTLATRICSAKVESQAALVRYWARNRRRTEDVELINALNESAAEIMHYATRIASTAKENDDIESIRDVLMGLEGQAARLYWNAVSRLIPVDYHWTGRNGRGATDPLNSLLNYGYAILYAEVERALLQAGLDPYAGFLHADRSGKPSLVLDITELFRQAMIDRVVFGLATRRYRIEQDTDGLLTSPTRRDFAERIRHQLTIKMRYKGQRTALQKIIQAQAQHLASFLRGDETKSGELSIFHAFIVE